jgi:Uma2 family endonuclease
MVRRRLIFPNSLLTATARDWYDRDCGGNFSIELSVNRMSTVVRLTTADELLKLPRGKARYELIKGELHTMSPAGSEHGVVIGTLFLLIAQFVKGKQLGLMFGAESGFLVHRNPDTVLAPDIAFVRRDRVPTGGPPKKFWPGAPDLAIEVTSPGDSTREIDEKASDWLRAGCQAVWIVDPHRKTVMTCRSGGATETFTETEDLDGGDILPGFRCSVVEIFADIG